MPFKSLLSSARAGQDWNSRKVFVSVTERVQSLRGTKAKRYLTGWGTAWAKAYSVPRFHQLNQDVTFVRLVPLVAGLAAHSSSANSFTDVQQRFPCCSLILTKPQCHFWVNDGQRVRFIDCSSCVITDTPAVWAGWCQCHAEHIGQEWGENDSVAARGIPEPLEG